MKPKPKYAHFAKVLKKVKEERQSVSVNIPDNGGIDVDKENNAGHGLNFAQQRFCEEYVYDWNGTRSYQAAYPNASYETAMVNASVLLRNTKVLEYIKLLKGRVAEMAGISKLMVVKEASKMAFSSIAHLHNDWIELSQFEKLTPEQKACIERIETKTEKKLVPAMDDTFDEYEVKYVKIVLYDKLKAIEILNKMMGWNDVEKLDVTSKGNQLPVLEQVTEIRVVHSKYEDGDTGQ